MRRRLGSRPADLKLPAAHMGIARADRLTLGRSTTSQATPLAVRGSPSHNRLDRGDCRLLPASRTLFFVLNVFAIATARLSETLLPIFDMMPACAAPCFPSVLIWPLASPLAKHRLAEGRRQNSSVNFDGQRHI